jgi:Holliday junction resolvase RusA-like endonuclease
MEKRTVRIKSYRLQIADKDNLAGGMKLLLDAMTDALYIFDDGPKFLDLNITGAGEEAGRAEDRGQRFLVDLESGILFV